MCSCVLGNYLWNSWKSVIILRVTSNGDEVDLDSREGENEGGRKNVKVR